MGRWQLGTPFYALIMSSLNTQLGWGFWTTACIANLIGSLFFYKIDGWIFKKKKPNDYPGLIKAFDNIISFGYIVLKSESIKDYKIKVISGDEGYCNRDKKEIHIGIDAVNNNDFSDYKLMLHEIAHILTEAYHCSDEFEKTEKRLNDKYLRV